jgi:hypothetical protein
MYIVLIFFIFYHYLCKSKKKEDEYGFDWRYSEAIFGEIWEK